MKKNVGIIGLGYVGLPLAINFGKQNFCKVYGFDEDNNKIQSIKKGKSYLSHIPSNKIKKFIKKNEVTNDYSKISLMDIIILCLPTPLTRKLQPDLTYIKSSLKKIMPYLKKNQSISLESSTYPGTTEELLIKKLSQKFIVGKNFHVIYSPEREDPGNKIQMENIPKILSGYSEKCKIIGKKYYSKVFKKVIVVESLKVAEFSKILENVFRSINIGLANEMKVISHKMGVDIFEVIKAASSKPFGFLPFYPGPGVGGHCIPLDPFYLTWKAKKYGLKTKFIELAHRVNFDMKKWIVGNIGREMTQIKKKKILVIGIAYKKDIDDCRESPSLGIISELKKNGAVISYHDPFVKKIPLTRKYKLNFNSINLTKNTILKSDAVLILTDHSSIDYNLIKKYSKKIFDTRGVYKVDENKIFRI